MANTTLTQTGAEVQAAINKAEKLPTVTGSDEGKTLQVDSSGNFVANTVSGGGSTINGHSVSFANNPSFNNLRITYLDTNLKVHYANLTYQETIQTTFTNVHKIIGLYTYNGTSQQPNYWYTDVANAILMYSNPLGGPSYVSANRGKSAFFDCDKPCEYYIEKDVIITFEYVGGGGGK